MSQSPHAVDAHPMDGVSVDTTPSKAPRLADAPGGMKLLLQPVHALAGGTLLGAEATDPAGKPTTRGWRGHRPASAEMSAAEMSAADMSAAEMSAADMSAALLQSACREAQAWTADPTRRLGPPAGLRVSVCVPASVIGGRAMLAQTRLALEQSELAPELLEITIMEHAMGNEAQEMLLAVSALRDLGAGVVLDHFTGGSNGLRMLRRLPVTGIWLAPSLTADMAYHREARAAAAVITFAHALDASVVARGVADPLQRAILADLGCDGGQGPVFGAPMEACMFRHALTGWLDD